MTNTLSALPVEKPRVLVVDDEQYIREIVADFLTLEGYQVTTAEDGVAALSELQRAHFDVVISDLKMPRIGGLELLREATRIHPDTLTVIMTGYGTVETAIDAMKSGAYDYVLKPFKVDEILHVVRRAVEKRRLTAENLRLREAISLYKVSEAITASLSLDEVIATVVDSTLQEARADVAMVWLENGEGSHYLRTLSGSAEVPGELLEARLKERLHTNGFLVEHGLRAREFFVQSPDCQIESLAVVSLKMRERLLGWVMAVSLSAHKRFDEGQRKLLSIVASRAAAAIENARLYEDLQATFQQTIQGLAKTIDKLDRYTAGHSERVAHYAETLARWLKLPERDIEIVRHSALMHDIGKIGCVLNLNKPGKLSGDEYEIFKRHPVYGREILDPIKFLGPVIPGVYLHHERWDGRGYPIGLVGQNIPVMARIISVADTYDAMTSDRAYRRALPHEVAIYEIGRCSGSQFDPEIAHVFIERIDGMREELSEAGSSVPE